MTAAPRDKSKPKWAAGAPAAFTFCECVECEFTVVVRSADIGPGMVVGCPLCWADNRREVPMTARPALDSDRPEGTDFRKLPATSTYVCHGCGKTCVSQVTDEEAEKEFVQIYGQKYNPEKHPTICDDCFRARHPT